MIYLLIVTHWLADFVFQTDDMAKNKSKSNFWLSYHVMMYGTIIWAFCIFLVATQGLRPDFNYLKFALINTGSHFAIDYVTSRMTSKLWAKGEVHNFFVVIGFDQALHMLILVSTYNWLLA